MLPLNRIQQRNIQNPTKNPSISTLEPFNHFSVLRKSSCSETLAAALWSFERSFLKSKKPGCDAPPYKHVARIVLTRAPLWMHLRRHFCWRFASVPTKVWERRGEDVHRVLRRETCQKERGEKRRARRKWPRRREKSTRFRRSFSSLSFSLSFYPFIFFFISTS